MNAERPRRKLTAILSADVEGYTRLIDDDEAVTLQTITAYPEVMSGLIHGHDGRVMDSEGDSLVAEFDSIVDAVRCAAKIQEEVRVRNAALSEGRRIAFRIGISLGDVIRDEKAVYGDVVNIAAGLKGLAEGGEICISEKAYQEVKNKLPLGYERLGRRSLRNGAEPVTVYKVLLEPKVTGKVAAEKKERPKTWGRIAIATVLLALMAGALAFWNFYLRPPPVEIASVERTEIPQPDTPSIEEEGKRLEEMRELQEAIQTYEERAKASEESIKALQHKLERSEREEEEARKRRIEQERIRKKEEKKRALREQEERLSRERKLEEERRVLEKNLQEDQAKIKALVERMKRLERELELERKRTVVKERSTKDHEALKALEVELRKLQAEVKRSSQTVKELEVKKPPEPRLISIPEITREPEIGRIRLRGTPRSLWDSDIEEMIKKHNFYLKGQNESGDFPNRFVDNEDGTVTDAATGLMWERGGSSSAVFYQAAEGYVVRLNELKYRGYNDWRIPTTEELASLLERERNKAALHIGPLFEWKQEECWSSDRHAGWSGRGIHNCTVNFYTGSIDKRIATHGDLEIGRGFVKAVRSMHERESASGRGQEQPLAYVPKKGKTPQVIRVKLRSDPKVIQHSDIEAMISKYGFFVKYLNEVEGFPNDFVDNGDGTVTDRVTGLMWQKGGSSSAIQYRQAQEFVSRLNKEKFLGYEDWRIPTLEELCSLLEPKVNDEGQHINVFFSRKQTACWSGDYRDAQRSIPIMWYHIVDFSSGRVGAEYGPHRMAHEGYCFIRAVRSIHQRETGSARVRDNRLAYVPKKGKIPQAIKVKLRSDPKELWDSDIEKMISKHNFFARYRNDVGSFPNDFVDNGDGTVTDRVTGLMWERAGSSEMIEYRDAEKIVSRLNKGKYLGYEDWRIPTLEELCSLLESKLNDKGQYIDALFNRRQRACWSSDRQSHPGWHYHHVVDFSYGKVSWGRGRSEHYTPSFEDWYFVRAVRSIE